MTTLRNRLRNLITRSGSYHYSGPISISRQDVDSWRGQGHGILAPIWVSLTAYMETIRLLSQGIERFSLIPSAQEGIDLYTEYLKNDIATGLNVPVEQLTPEVMNPRGLENLARYAEFTPNSRIITHDMWALRQGFESFAVYEDQEGETIHSDLIGMYITNASLIIIDIIGNRIERSNLEAVEIICYGMVDRMINFNHGSAFSPPDFLGTHEREILGRLAIEMIQQPLNGMNIAGARASGRTTRAVRRCIALGGIYIVHNGSEVQRLQGLYPN
ncbi:hypothetical protein LCGC14_2066220, partial [marine sediment metagenome]